MFGGWTYTFSVLELSVRLISIGNSSAAPTSSSVFENDSASSSSIFLTMVRCSSESPSISTSGMWSYRFSLMLNSASPFDHSRQLSYETSLTLCSWILASPEFTVVDEELPFNFTLVEWLTLLVGGSLGLLTLSMWCHVLLDCWLGCWLDKLNLQQP